MQLLLRVLQLQRLLLRVLHLRAMRRHRRPQLVRLRLDTGRLLAQRSDLLALVQRDPGLLRQLALRPPR